MVNLMGVKTEKKCFQHHKDAFLTFKLTSRRWGWGLLLLLLRVSHLRVRQMQLGWSTAHRTVVRTGQLRRLPRLYLLRVVSKH